MSRNINKKKREWEEEQKKKDSAKFHKSIQSWASEFKQKLSTFINETQRKNIK